MKKCIVIGSGFAGLASACYLAKDGYDVTIYEKNNTIGGRARQFKKEGFTRLWIKLGSKKCAMSVCLLARLSWNMKT